MKKLHVLIPSLVATASMPLISMVGCGGGETPPTPPEPEPVEPTNIILNETSLALGQGETFELKATIEPEGTTCDLEWTSSNDFIVSVSDKGLVTAKEQGDATITVKTVGYDFSDTCSVHVVDPLTPRPPNGDYLSIKSNSQESQVDISMYSEDNQPVFPNLQYWDGYSKWIDCSFEPFGSSEVYYDSYVDITSTNDYTIYLRGNNPDGFSTVGSQSRSISILCADDTETRWTIGGSVMALVDGGETSLNPIIPNDSCFSYLFEDNLHIEFVEDDILPAKTLKDNCYNGMFNYCEHLKNAPKLYATTLTNGCYRSMFSMCESLEETCEMPVALLANNCYDSMYRDSANITTFKLVKISNIPANVESACAWMFANNPEASGFDAKYGFIETDSDEGVVIDLSKCSLDTGNNFDKMFDGRGGVEATTGKKYALTSL